MEAFFWALLWAAATVRRRVTAAARGVAGRGLRRRQWVNPLPTPSRPLGSSRGGWSYLEGFSSYDMIQMQPMRS